MLSKESVKSTHLKPFMIGNIRIENPLVLAPMEGHSNYALRSLCREQGGCGLVYTEFISSNMLNRKGERKKSLARFDWRESEFPLSVQIFGNDPEVLAAGAQTVVEHGAAIVDINMGCWVPKIAKKGSGAALLKDVDTARRVVDAVVNAVDVPVTVKVRSGFEDGVITAVPFAKAAYECGVKAIAVHARFAGQGHKGAADWDVIRQVKEAVPELPVIGNGDVKTPQDAKRMLEETGCDGAMVGRAALGQPWLFAHMEHYLKTGDLLPQPTRRERALLALEHARRTLATSWMPERKIVLELRGQLSKYQLNEPGTMHIRNRLVRVENFAEVETILLEVIEAED